MKLSKMPPAEVVKHYKGVIDIYQTAQGPRARSWPRKPLLPRSPAVSAKAAALKEISRAHKQSSKYYIHQLAVLSERTKWTWRDNFLRHLYGTTIPRQLINCLEYYEEYPIYGAGGLVGWFPEYCGGHWAQYPNTGPNAAWRYYIGCAPRWSTNIDICYTDIPPPVLWTDAPSSPHRIAMRRDQVIPSSFTSAWVQSRNWTKADHVIYAQTVASSFHSIAYNTCGGPLFQLPLEGWVWWQTPLTTGEPFPNWPELNTESIRPGRSPVYYYYGVPPQPPYLPPITVPPNPGRNNVYADLRRFFVWDNTLKDLYTALRHVNLPVLDPWGYLLDQHFPQKTRNQRLALNEFAFPRLL